MLITKVIKILPYVYKVILLLVKMQYMLSVKLNARMLLLMVALV